MDLVQGTYARHQAVIVLEEVSSREVFKEVGTVGGTGLDQARFEVRVKDQFPGESQ